MKKKFKCEESSKSFSRADAYKRNLNTHTDEKKFKCEECHANFSREDDLRRHQINTMLHLLSTFAKLAIKFLIKSQIFYNIKEPTILATISLS